MYITYLPFLLLLVAAYISASAANDDKQFNSSSDDTFITLQVPTLEETTLADPLSFGYYCKICPQFESIIQQKVKEWHKKDHTLAASLLRLPFEDCSIRGCDGSILLKHEGSERTAKVSKTLRGFEVVDDIKAELEKQCPRTVSCADILTTAARDATVVLGGPHWDIQYGRKDGKVSIDKEAEIVPKGHENVTSLIEFFQSKGLTVFDMVVQSGAHTIGRATCGSIQFRLYDYKGTGKPDPTLDPKYVSFLQRKCRWASEYVDLDATTPKTFDRVCYKNLQKKMGLLYTDQVLYSDPRTSLVSTLSATPYLFRHQFAVSMEKFSVIEVLTGQDEGEIRDNCNFMNT